MCYNIVVFEFVHCFINIHSVNDGKETKMAPYNVNKVIQEYSVKCQHVFLDSSIVSSVTKQPIRVYNLLPVYNGVACLLYMNGLVLCVHERVCMDGDYF